MPLFPSSFQASPWSAPGTSAVSPGLHIRTRHHWPAPLGCPHCPAPPLRAGKPTPINRQGGDPGQAGGSPREPPPPGISQQTFIQHLLCAGTWALDQMASFRPVRSAQEGPEPREELSSPQPPARGRLAPPQGPRTARLRDGVLSALPAGPGSPRLFLTHRLRVQPPWAQLFTQYLLSK